MTIAVKLAEFGIALDNLTRLSDAADIALQARERIDADYRLKVLAVQEQARRVREEWRVIQQMRAMQ